MVSPKRGRAMNQNEGGGEKLFPQKKNSAQTRENGKNFIKKKFVIRTPNQAYIQDLLCVGWIQQVSPNLDFQSITAISSGEQWKDIFRKRFKK